MKKRDFVNGQILVDYLRSKGVLNSEEVADQLVEFLSEEVQNRVKRAKNAARIAKNDELKDTIPARDALNDSQIKSLPRWVREVLDEARVVGKSGQVIQAPSGRKYHLGNSLNDLSGAEWTFFTNSVINSRYPTAGPESFAHHIRKIHPSPKPPQLMRDIIKFFTKENELVFDYFMGVGGTLLGASLSNRRAIGVDLSARYIEAYQQASNELGLPCQKTVEADSLRLVSDPLAMKELLEGDEISLIAIDPPYGDMMNRTKTGEAAKKKLDTSPTPFTNSEADLGNVPLSDFYPMFKKSVADAMVHLRQRGHIVVFTKDIQPHGMATNLLHARIIEDLNDIEGLQYLGTKIWADHSVNLYPYGYPYSFVANQTHQYILIFRKVS